MNYKKITSQYAKAKTKSEMTVLHQMILYKASTHIIMYAIVRSFDANMSFLIY